MKPKIRIEPIWIIGNNALAETINPEVSTGIVAYLQECLDWGLESKENVLVWDGLGDVNAYHEE